MAKLLVMFAQFFAKLVMYGASELPMILCVRMVFEDDELNVLCGERIARHRRRRGFQDRRCAGNGAAVQQCAKRCRKDCFYDSESPESRERWVRRLPPETKVSTASIAFFTRSEAPTIFSPTSRVRSATLRAAPYRLTRSAFRILNHLRDRRFLLA